MRTYAIRNMKTNKYLRIYHLIDKELVWTEDIRECATNKNESFMQTFINMYDLRNCKVVPVEMVEILNN